MYHTERQGSRMAVDGRSVGSRIELGWQEHYASINGKAKVVECLLEKDAGVDASDKCKWTALHWASDRGFEKIAILLVKKDAETSARIDEEHSDQHNRPDRRLDGSTALHLACARGHDEAVKALLLLDGGANANEKNEHLQWTPLHIACSYNQAQAVKILLDANRLDVNAKDETGRTALNLACEGNRTDVIDTLLTCSKVKVAAGDKDGRTPLHWAVSNSDVASVKLLLAMEGVDVNAKATWTWYNFHDNGDDSFGEDEVRYNVTPFDLACGKSMAALSDPQTKRNANLAVQEPSRLVLEANAPDHQLEIVQLLTEKVGKMHDLVVRLIELALQNESSQSEQERKLDNLKTVVLNLHRGAGNHRDLPALWVVEKMEKPKSKHLIWILSENSGRCFHKPIEIKVSKTVEVYGRWLEAGISLLADVIPSIPLLKNVVDNAIGELKSNTDKAIRVHDMVDKLRLESCGKVNTHDNHHLSPSESFVLLNLLLEEHKRTCADTTQSITSIADLECATLDNGSYLWAHPEEHFYHQHRLRVAPITASVASDPTSSTPAAVSTSKSHHPMYYLSNIYIENLADDEDWRLAYCEWKLSHPSRQEDVEAGQAVQNPHKVARAQSLWLQSFTLATIYSESELKECTLQVELKRPRKMRSTHSIGSGSILLRSVDLTNPIIVSL